MHAPKALPLLACLPVLGLTGCDKVLNALADAADGEMCLSSLLDLADLTRDDISGPGADELLMAALEAQKEVIGEAFVVDCDARDSLASLSGSSGSAADGEGEAPPRTAETSTVGSADQVGGAILDAVQSGGSDGMEVAILLDTTGSMRDDTEAVQAAVADIIAEVKSNNGHIAMASFGDNQGCDDPAWFAINPGGLIDLGASTSLLSTEDDLWAGVVDTHGCDWPESLYDAVWETAGRLDWKSKNRRIIAITDAPPLEPPKSEHTPEEVGGRLTDLGISLDTVLVGISY